MLNDNNASEKLRELLIQYFKRRPRMEITNIYNPFDQLEDFIVSEGLTSLDLRRNSIVKSMLVTTLWDMVLERIIEPELGIPASPPGDIGIRAFRLTKYGEQLLQGLPIDRPSEYIDYLKSQVPDIDPQIIVYVRECLHSYNLGCYFAASVMLGVAAERLFELLLDAYINAIQDQAKQERFRKKVAGKGISQQYDEFKKKLPDLVGSNGLTAEDGPSTRRFRDEFRHAIEITFNTSST